MIKPKNISEQAADEMAAVGGVSVNNISKTDILDPAILNRDRVFAEAVRQTTPLCPQGSHQAARVSRVVSEGAASQHGLRPETCERLVTSGRKLESLISGAHPSGKTAEVVALTDYRELHSGKNPGIVNSPEYVAQNVHDIRLSPHHASRKDLFFQYRADNGYIITKYNGQVKTGSAQYVSESLVEMAETPGYGKVGYVDACFVNPDGTPRIATDAFNPEQARRLTGAKVRLRGILNLNKRAEYLIDDINKHAEDGLSPAVREQLQQLRNDIATAYEYKSVAGRLASGAAVTAASAALLSLLMQYATEGKLDPTAAATAAGKASLYGASGVLADAGLYHAGVQLAGMTEEAAKGFAQQGVAVGFCAIAIGVDIYSEVALCREGQVSATNATAASSMKAALNLLPFVLAPLGLIGVPILIVTQIGGRWVIAKSRQADEIVNESVEQHSHLVDEINGQLSRIEEACAEATTQCNEIDRLLGLTS